MNSNFIEFVTNQASVPIETVTLILIIPLVVTLIAFFRQVLGIKAFGIYTPALVTFAFLAIGAQADSFWKGLKYGVFIFVLVLAVGLATRAILKKLRLLYLPRMAIVITMVSLTTLLVLVGGGLFKMTGLVSISIFPILIMITLVEKFVSTYIEKGIRQANILSLETLVISVFCYFLLGWQELIIFIQNYPWVIVLTIPINILLGKWTGLRVSEYFRFKDIIKNAQNSSKK